jgi:hypothetical protein
MTRFGNGTKNELQNMRLLTSGALVLILVSIEGYISNALIGGALKRPTTRSTMRGCWLSREKLHATFVNRSSSTSQEANAGDRLDQRA